MFKPAAEISPFRLRPASAASEVASSSMLRVARTTAVARQAPVLQQRSRSTGQMAFDFKR